MDNLQPGPESEVEWVMLMESQPEPKSVVEWLVESEPEPDLVPQLEPKAVVHDEPKQRFPEFCCAYDVHKQWQGLFKPVRGRRKTYSVYSVVEDLDGKSWTGTQVFTPSHYGQWIWYRRLDHFMDVSGSSLQCKSHCYTSFLNRMHPDDYIFFFLTLDAAHRFKDQFCQITCTVPFLDEENTDEEDSGVSVTSHSDAQGSHSSGDSGDSQPGKDAKPELSPETSNPKSEHGEIAEAELEFEPSAENSSPNSKHAEVSEDEVDPEIRSGSEFEDGWSMEAGCIGDEYRSELCEWRQAQEFGIDEKMDDVNRPWEYRYDFGIRPLKKNVVEIQRLLRFRTERKCQLSMVRT